MKIYKTIFSIIFGFIFFTLGIPSVNAESNIISEAGIFDAKIVSQDDTKISISFEVKNGKDIVSSNLRYGVSVYKKESGKTLLKDVYIYPEFLNLNRNERVIKSIDYIYPNSLNGEHQIFLNLVNSSSMILASTPLGQIKFDRRIKTPEIVANSCYLQNNEKSYKGKDLIEFETTTPIVLVCNVLNQTGKTFEFTPVSEIYENSLYGILLKEISLDKIVLKDKEQKTINFNLPVISNPGFYSVKVYLKNTESKSESTNIEFSIKGKNVFIKELSLNRDYFRAGDNALIDLFWTINGKSSFESFNNIKLNLDILDYKNKSCLSKRVDKTLNYSKNNGFEKGKVEIKRNCKDPQVKVELKNENGEILDSKVFSFNSNEEIIKNYNIKLFKNILYIFIGVLVVGGILFYFIKIKNKKNEEITK